ncbi:MAG: hypothetical protein KKC80_08770, partial [Candidatus Margulisbacteria bacterium]|nr:hypothetical protein [Candidatus Margulisiibacteriota bacterium]
NQNKIFLFACLSFISAIFWLGILTIGINSDFNKLLIDTATEYNHSLNSFMDLVFILFFSMLLSFILILTVILDIRSLAIFQIFIFFYSLFQSVTVCLSILQYIKLYCKFVNVP